MENKANIRPLGDKVVVRALTEEESDTKSPSGIIIPDTIASKDKEKGEQGVVEAVGPGRYEDGKQIPMEVKVGDRILFTSWREKVEVGGVEYSVISESDILGVITV